MQTARSVVSGGDVLDAWGPEHAATGEKGCHTVTTNPTSLKQFYLLSTPVSNFLQSIDSNDTVDVGVSSNHDAEMLAAEVDV